MSDPQHFILATAGHVDHGKSALVKALTGTDPDRLPEEKLRGITIDLGFAHLELPSRSSACSSFLIGIVDVPGHEAFVKNMVAGVGSIDLALLVVAADDGWMPQTEEHLQILDYLGVNRAAVALTKVDLIQDEKAAAAAIREKLEGTPFSKAPIIATSVVSGRGLEQLKTALGQIVASTPLPADIGKPRLPVDRVFKLHGVGTIVTGTLTGGTLNTEQEVVIQPSGKKTRIRSIQSHNQKVQAASPGTRTALNLPDLNGLEDVHRGDTVTLEALGGPGRIVDASLKISPRASRPLKEGNRVRIHHGSCNVAARVSFYGVADLAAGANALAQLSLESPTFLFTGDRFIVRDWAEQNTLAGGIVLDPESSLKMFRSETRLKSLADRAQSPDDLSRHLISQVTREGATKKSQLLLKSRFSSGAVSETVSQLAAAGKIVLSGECAFAPERWLALRQRAADAIDAHHRAHPEQMGLPLTELRNALRTDLAVAEHFEAFLKEFCTRDFTRVGTVIRRASHRPALPERLQGAGSKLRSALAAKPFDPPSRKELAPDPSSQQALRYLIETGEVVEINAELVIEQQNLHRATELIRKFIRENGPSTVAELRQMLASSRRVVVPLLERLDREGVTLRREDRRTLRG